MCTDPRTFLLSSAAVSASAPARRSTRSYVEGGSETRPADRRSSMCRSEVVRSWGPNAFFSSVSSEARVGGARRRVRVVDFGGGAISKSSVLSRVTIAGAILKAGFRAGRVAL